jgi:peroxiredoxin Q/BCP
MADVGDRAPPVSFTKADGTSVQLADYLGKGTVVLYFYPKDHTPGCTAEACSFRDAYEDFKAAGAEVIGVSADDGASHEGFKAKHKLPFVLLSDPGSVASKAMGVKRAFLGLIPGRVTFVIDRAGVIRHRFESSVNMQKHIDEALALVRTLEQQPTAA